MKILVIEDEIKLADYLHKGLTEEGFVVDVAHNGIDGLHLAVEGQHDVIVLDRMLPGINGIGVLAALIVPNVLNRADDARVMAAKTDVNNLVQALKLYKLDNQRLPSAEQGLQALIAKPTSGPIPSNWKPYLDKLPNDPWGRPYQYLNPGVKGETDVLSLGADGQAGGEGKDADIGSWQ